MMARIRAGLYLFLLFCVFLSAMPQLTLAQGEVLEFHYFYVNACSDCREAEDRIKNYLEQLWATYPDQEIKLFSYNIANPQELIRMTEFCQAYEVLDHQAQIPLLFIGTYYFSGEVAIERALNDNSLTRERMTAPLPAVLSRELEGAQKLNENFAAMNWLNAFLVGLINGVNPCALSMLLFLLSLLLARQDISALKIGLAFLLGKFVTYILLGTLLYQVLAEINMTTYQLLFKVVFAVFLSFLAFINLADYFKARKEAYGQIKNQLPSRLRKWNQRLLTRLKGIENERYLVLAGIALGAIISIGEFLCTGQVYLATIVYLIQTNSNFSLQAFFFLALYSFALIMPLFLLLLLVAKTRRLMAITDIVRKKIPLIKLATVAVLMFFVFLSLFMH